MPRRNSSTLVPHSAEDMFDLVADVERYPEFLPWCRALRVINSETEGDQTILTADMLVGFRMFRETFRSRVVLDKPALTIDTTYIRGPMRHMENIWRFEPHSSQIDDGATDDSGPTESTVHFGVSFALRNPLLHQAASAVFEEEFARLSEAFVDRAGEIYA